MKKLSYVLVLLASFLTSEKSFSLPNNPTPLGDASLVPYGTVYASKAAEDGSTYIGGDFTYVGSYTGSGVVVNMVNGSLITPYPKVNGPVLAAASDGEGGWYIGGDFSRVGNVTRNNLAHILADGSVDEVWTPSTNARVQAIYVTYTIMLGRSIVDKIYVGGRFDRVTAARSATPVSSQVANFNPDGSLDAGFVYPCDAFGTPEGISSFAVSSDTLYVGGDFQCIGLTDALNLIAVNRNTGAFLSTFTPRPNGTVYSMQLEGGDLYVAGRFSNVFGRDRNRLAKINLSAGSLDTSWNPNADSTVYSIVKDGTTIYVGGEFSRIGTASIFQVAAVNSVDGALTSWRRANGFIQRVTSLFVQAGRLYVGGDFTNIDSRDRRYAAAFSTSDGTLTDWNPNLSDTSHVYIFGGAERIFLGGYFVSAGAGSDRERRGFAKITSDGHLSSDCTPSFRATAGESVVKSIAIGEGGVYVGGRFDQAGASPSSLSSRVNLAKFRLSDCALDSWYPGEMVPSSSVVNSLELIPENHMVYVGGTLFTAIGSESGLTGLARIATETGIVDASWKPQIGCSGGCLLTINSTKMAPSFSTIFVGGFFTSVGGVSRNNLANINTGDVALSTPTFPTTNAQVKKLGMKEDVLYVAGDFNSVDSGSGAVTRNAFFSMDTRFSSLTAWAPRVEGSPSATGVNDFVLSENTVYLGGRFERVNGSLHGNLAALDLTTGLNRNWNPQVLFSQIFTLSLSQNYLNVAGTKASSNGYAIINSNLANFSLPEVSLESSAYEGNEGDSILVGVNLSVVDTDDVIVRYRSSENTATAVSDYSPIEGTVIIRAGSRGANTSLTLTNNSIYEPEENFYLNLQSADTAKISSASVALVTIRDNDPAPIFSFDTATSASAENTGLTSVTVVRANDSQETVSVRCRPAGTGTADFGIDYLMSDSVLIFNSGVMSQLCPYTVIDDSLFEGDEVFGVSLISPTLGTIGTLGTMTITINDNERAPGGGGVSGGSGGVSGVAGGFSGSSGMSGGSGGGAGVFGVGGGIGGVGGGSGVSGGAGGGIGGMSGTGGISGSGEISGHSGSSAGSFGSSAGISGEDGGGGASGTSGVEGGTAGTSTAPSASSDTGGGCSCYLEE